MMNKMLKMLSHQYGGETIEDVERLVVRGVYKYTNYGASCYFPEEGYRVHVAGYVEGTDIDCTVFELTWPFTMEDWWDALTACEEEASEIWDRTHGCDDCGSENELGGIDISPSCPSCKGEGVII